MKKPGGTKWKKWQHGFLCSQYYLGYFKCILQDYSKKYYNISFPYINRWTRGTLVSNTRLPCFSIRCQPHREYCIRHPSTWFKTKLFVRRPSFNNPFPILQSISGLSLCNPHNYGCLTPLYQLVQSDYLYIPLILFSCWYTLCIRLITCQSLLLPNTSTHLLESHPFPLSLLSSFVITLLFSTSFLLTHCVKPLFVTPSSESNL